MKLRPAIPVSQTAASVFSMPMSGRAWKLVALAVLAFGTVCECRAGDIAAPKEEIKIRRNTQARTHELSIAAYNIREESYREETGKDTKGLTAAIQVTVEKDSSQNAKLRVHKGQRFQVGQQIFEVRAITPDSITLGNR